MESLKDYFWSNEKDLLQQIEIAKTKYSIVVNSKHCEDELVTGKWIPFNLERRYVDMLIDGKRYAEAKGWLQKMRVSYIDSDFQNFIESYEYRLYSILHLDNEIKEQIQSAKKEFNQHTVTLITVIVGLITIFGVANNALRATDFREGVITFFAIVAPLLLVLAVTLFFVNKK